MRVFPWDWHMGSYMVLVEFYGSNVGKYTVRPMDPMGLVLSKSYPIIWDGKPLPGFQSPVRMITFFSFSIRGSLLTSSWHPRNLVWHPNEYCSMMPRFCRSNESETLFPPYSSFRARWVGGEVEKKRRKGREKKTTPYEDVKVVEAHLFGFC